MQRATERFCRVDKDWPRRPGVTTGDELVEVICPSCAKKRTRTGRREQGAFLQGAAERFCRVDKDRPREPGVTTGDELGEGSTFPVYLPILREKANAGREA